MTLESLKADSGIRKQVQETVKQHLGGYLPQVETFNHNTGRKHELIPAETTMVGSGK